MSKYLTEEIISFYKKEGWEDVFVKKVINGIDVLLPIGHTFKKNNTDLLLQITGNKIRMFKPSLKNEGCYLYNEWVIHLKNIL